MEMTVVCPLCLGDGECLHLGDNSNMCDSIPVTCPSCSGSGTITFASMNRDLRLIKYMEILEEYSDYCAI